MSKLFSPTHRMLVRATEDHNYDMVEISVDSGLFRKVSIKMTETKIRVNKSILGEIFCIGGVTKPLGLDEIQVVAATFNEVRIAAGYESLVFRLTEEIKRVRKQDERIPPVSFYISTF